MVGLAAVMAEWGASNMCPAFPNKEILDAWNKYKSLECFGKLEQDSIVMFELYKAFAIGYINSRKQYDSSFEGQTMSMFDSAPTSFSKADKKEEWLKQRARDGG